MAKAKLIEIISQETLSEIESLSDNVEIFENDDETAFKINVKKEGVRLTINVTDTELNWTLFTRTSSGGMSKVDGSKLWGSIRDNRSSSFEQRIFAAFNEATPETINTAPPKPMQFVPSEEFGIDLAGNVRRGRSEIDSLSIISLVTKEGKIINEKIHDPNKEIWFHCSCSNKLGATFNIITNGEVFHPIDRYRKDAKGNYKITTRLSPKASVSLGDMSSLDQALIKFAIERFLAHEFGN